MERGSSRGRGPEAGAGGATEDDGFDDDGVVADRESRNRVVVDEARVRRARAHPSVAAALRDRRLQAVVERILAARDRGAALRAVMEENARFREFVDELLLALDCAVRRADGSIQFTA